MRTSELFSVVAVMCLALLSALCCSPKSVAEREACQQQCGSSIRQLAIASHAFAEKNGSSQKSVLCFV